MEFLLYLASRRLCGRAGRAVRGGRRDHHRAGAVFSLLHLTGLDPSILTHLAVGTSAGNNHIHLDQCGCASTIVAERCNGRFCLDDRGYPHRRRRRREDR